MVLRVFTSPPRLSPTLTRGRCTCNSILCRVVSRVESMSVWPEERVRERLERGGGTLDIEVSELLAQFGARRVTGRGKADADAALAEVGVRVEPPDWLDGEPAQLRLTLADLTAGDAPPEPTAPVVAEPAT